VVRYQNRKYFTAWQLDPYVSTSGWEFGQVQIDSSGEAKFYQILLEAWKGNTTTGYAAVDDLEFQEIVDECPTIIGPGNYLLKTL
jgi:hypothetical protein